MIEKIASPTSIKANFVAPDSLKVRQVQREGRPFLVVPVVMIVEGVLNNEFVPFEEFAHFEDTWNGIPITLGHTQNKDGVDVSANTPEFELTQTIGRVFKAKAESGKLIAEAWIDVMKARRVGGDALILLKRLENGEGVEISVAFFRDVEVTDGLFGGDNFEAISRNIRPDHLAVLVNEEGACNWGDGCGLPRAAKKQKEDAAEDQHKKKDGEISPNKSQTQGEISMSNKDKDKDKDEDEEDIDQSQDADNQDDADDNQGDADDSQDDADESEEEDEEEDETPDSDDSFSRDEIQELRRLARDVKAMGGIRAIKQVVTHHKAETKQERGLLINSLSEASDFSKKELSEMPLDHLRKMGRMTSVRDYSGMGSIAARNASVGEIDDNSPPSIFGGEA